MLRFDVLTLFPGMFAPVLTHSMLKRGQDKGLLTVKVHNLRDFTPDRHKVVDDMPYGGGAGMVMKAEPILLAVGAIRHEAQASGEDIRIVFPTPHGRPLHKTMRSSWRVSAAESSSCAGIMREWMSVSV